MHPERLRDDQFSSKIRRYLIRSVRRQRNAQWTHIELSRSKRETTYPQGDMLQSFDYREKKGFSEIFEAEIPVFALVSLFHPLLYRFRGRWRRDDDFVAWLPVRRGRNLMLIRGLKGLSKPEDLGHRAAVGHGVVEHGTHDPLIIDEEDRPDGRGIALPGMDHPVAPGDLHVKIGDDREMDIDTHLLLDVPHPGEVGVDTIDGESDELSVQFGELIGDLDERYELSRTDRREIGRVGEEDDPLPFVV